MSRSAFDEQPCTVDIRHFVQLRRSHLFIAGVGRLWQLRAGGPTCSEQTRSVKVPYILAGWNLVQDDFDHVAPTELSFHVRDTATNRSLLRS